MKKNLFQLAFPRIFLMVIRVSGTGTNNAGQAGRKHSNILFERIGVFQSYEEMQNQISMGNHGLLAQIAYFEGQMKHLQQPYKRSLWRACARFESWIVDLRLWWRQPDGGIEGKSG